MNSALLSNRWYAVYTKSRNEKKVHQNLTTSGYTSFLPLEETIKQWSDRKKKVSVPLIPSYLFVQTQENNLRDILTVTGVVKILSYLGKPAIIKDYEIKNLKILLNDSEKFNSIEAHNLKKGDSVIVEKGIFEGLIGEYIKLRGKHRLIVRIEAIDSFFEVNIPLSYIRKL